MPKAHGRGAAIAVFAALTMMLSVSCGSPSDAETTAEGQAGPDVGADYVAEVVDGTLTSPVLRALDAGAVLYGGREGAETQRLTGLGVVLDVQGRVRTSFETPVPLDRAVVASLGETFVVGGVSCENDVTPDEATGDLDCAPGQLELYEVDSTSGATEQVPLPDELTATGESWGVTFDLLAGGTTLLLTVDQAAGSDTVRRAWFRDAEVWRPIEAEDGFLCATAGHLLLTTTETPDGEMDPTTRGPAEGSVSVLDPGDGTWGEPVTAPATETSIGTGLKTECTMSRLVLLPWTDRSEPATGASFDPASGTWQEFEAPARLGAAEPFGSRASDLLAFIGVGTDEPNSVLDTTTGHVTDQTTTGTLLDGVYDLVVAGSETILLLRVGPEGEIVPTEMVAS